MKYLQRKNGKIEIICYVRSNVCCTTYKTQQRIVHKNFYPRCKSTPKFKFSMRVAGHKVQLSNDMKRPICSDSHFNKNGSEWEHTAQHHNYQWFHKQLFLRYWPGYGVYAAWVIRGTGQVAAKHRSNQGKWQNHKNAN